MIGLFFFVSVLLSSVLCQNCTDDQFKCKSGPCIALSEVCDADFDCKQLDSTDTSDEECEGNTKCPEGLYRCFGDGKCIKDDARCDNILDCADGSDEENCGLENTTVNLNLSSTNQDLTTSFATSPSFIGPSSTLQTLSSASAISSSSSQVYDSSTGETPVTTSSTTPKDGIIPVDNNDESKEVLIGGLVGGLVLLAIILLVACHLCRHSRSKTSKGTIDDMNGRNNNEEMKSTHPDFPLTFSKTNSFTRPISYSKLADSQLAPQGEINYSIETYPDVEKTNYDMESPDCVEPNVRGFYI